MKVHWTQNALDHLVNIYEHIALNSLLYAKGMVDKLTRHSEQISDYPFSGRKVQQYDAKDVREIIEAPYRIIYRVKQDQIDIIAVVHCARLLPDDPVQEDFH